MIGNNPGTNETWKRIPNMSVGVELGVWKGDSSEKFLQRASHLHLVDSWSVTPYEDSDEFGDYQGYLSRYSKIVGSADPKRFQQYYNNVAASVVKRFRHRPVTIHRCTTDEFFSKFNEVVDWVYIDASHSFEGCLADLRNSLNIVRAGGLILGDDYKNRNKPGVTSAIEAFIEENGLPFDNFHLDQFEVQL